MWKAFLAVCLATIYLPALAQTEKEDHVPIFFEKAYLHTDRDVYGQGEDIWFKAYVVNAQNNQPINYSHNLYIELINPEAKIVIREMIRLENGLGNGDFKLKDTIPPGHYSLRAYTNWMRNFGDNFVFEKPVTILKTVDIHTMAANNKSAANQKNKDATEIVNTSSNPPVVRFYPEGGSLVQNISSLVAVKAEDANGRGMLVKGTVVSSSGDTISRFSCDSSGIGMFTLLPIAGQTYHAIVGEIGSLDFPIVISDGLTLQIKQTDSVIHVVISQSSLTSNSVNLVVKHGGKTQLNKQLQLQSLQTAFKIPTTALPEGISVITVYNSQSKPECERLIYVHHPKYTKNKISITTNKKNYQPKEQVKLNIQTLPRTSLSLAVVDAAAVPIQPENILSYLNLQSEVKGDIEQPDRYFDSTNVNRFKQLDMLLLTQGWREFLWRRIEDTTLKINYEPEQGIAITGKVRRVGTNKPLSGITINLHAPKAFGEKFFDAVTDSSGRFGIYGLNFYGYQYLYLNARNYSPKSKGKSNSGGWLQVDSLMKDILPIHQAKSSFDSISYTGNAVLKLNISPSRQLKEVNIRAVKPYTIPPENRTVFMSEQKDYGNVLQYLLYTIPEAHTGAGDCGVILMDNNIRKPGTISVGGSYADHSPMERSTCQSDFLQLPMSNVLKLTIYRWYDWLAGDFYLRLRVSLVLRPGSLKVKDFFDDTMADMVGYYKAREFYKPRFEKPDEIDLRTNTIHWEPDITTDATGKATVSFYNTAQTGKVRVIVQGITNSGIPLATSAEYEVK